MSNTYFVLLVIGYLLPVVLIALLMSSETRRTPRLIASLLIALPLFYVGHYLVLQQLQGWPSDAPLPETFRLLSFQIREPDPQHDRAGQILMWIESDPQASPRAHRLAYQKDLHQALVAAGRRQAEGRRQVGERRDDDRLVRTERSAGRSREVSSINFRDEERPSPPSKEVD
jgi:hypothetical protein